MSETIQEEKKKELQEVVHASLAEILKNIPEGIKPLEENQPHDSAYVYSSKKGRHWYKVAPSLREKDRSRGQWILLGLLVIFAVFGGQFLGFIIETQVLNPPTQVVGICPPPAYIVGDGPDGCVQKVTNIDSQGNAHTSVVPAGSIIGQNQSNIHCNGNVCVATP